MGDILQRARGVRTVAALIAEQSSAGVRRLDKGRGIHYTGKAVRVSVRHVLEYAFWTVGPTGLVGLRGETRSNTGPGPARTKGAHGFKRLSR